MSDEDLRKLMSLAKNPRLGPQTKIVLAAKLGRAARLTAEEVAVLARDDAITMAAQDDLNQQAVRYDVFRGKWLEPEES